MFSQCQDSGDVQRLAIFATTKKEAQTTDPEKSHARWLFHPHPLGNGVALESMAKDWNNWFVVSNQNAIIGLKYLTSLQDATERYRYNWSWDQNQSFQIT